MSTIDIHKVEIQEEADGEHAVPMIGEHNVMDSLTDGEELTAAWRLLKLLDNLNEGEALVIWRDIF